MTSSSTGPLLSYLKLRLVLNYTFVSAASALICDYFSMLPLEIKLIWFSKWTYTKVLFLLVRYTAFVGVALLLHDEITPNVSIEDCEVTNPMTIWLLMSQAFLAEVIFAVRTWAVWRRSIVVGIGLGFLTIVNIATQCMVLGMFTKSVKYAPRLYQGFWGCFVISSGTKTSIIYPIVFSVVEAVILIFMAVSAVRSCRRGGRSELFWVVHRDAILFYVFTLVVSLMFIIPFAPTIVWSPMALAIYSALTARMILNIRRVGNGGMETELHSKSPVFTTHLRFAPQDYNSHEGSAGTQPPRSLEDPIAMTFLITEH